MLTSPLMFQSWNHISFLHWCCPAESLENQLPAGLELDTHAGWAWISITPFLLENLRTSLIPPLPWISRFPETNLRTYVRGPAGAGIWFFSLDAARLAAVIAARSTFGLPYFWAQMRVHVDGVRVRYRSLRGHQASAAIDLEIGEPCNPDARTQFLTERYRLYALHMGRLISVPVRHRPWPLRHARILKLDQTLTAAAGLSIVGEPELTHYSPGVDVEILRRENVDSELLFREQYRNARLADPFSQTLI